jgi:hypothetical protein
MATQLQLQALRRIPVSERYEGFVEKLEADVAYITLENERGERFHGPYPAHELAAKGVGERDRFSLTLTDEDDSVRFDVRLIPRKEISAERQREIRQEIEQALGAYTPDDDY